jgi:hypothetical protein
VQGRLESGHTEGRLAVASPQHTATTQGVSYRSITGQYVRTRGGRRSQPVSTQRYHTPGPVTSLAGKEVACSRGDRRTGMQCCQASTVCGGRRPVQGTGPKRGTAEAQYLVQDPDLLPPISDLTRSGGMATGSTRCITRHSII